MPGHPVVHRMPGVQEPAELDRADAERYEAPAIEAHESLSDPLVGTFSGAMSKSDGDYSIILFYECHIADLISL